MDKFVPRRSLLPPPPLLLHPSKSREEEEEPFRFLFFSFFGKEEWRAGDGGEGVTPFSFSPSSDESFFTRLRRKKGKKKTAKKGMEREKKTEMENYFHSGTSDAADATEFKLTRGSHGKMKEKRKGLFPSARKCPRSISHLTSIKSNYPIQSTPTIIFPHLAFSYNILVCMVGPVCSPMHARATLTGREGGRMRASIIATHEESIFPHLRRKEEREREREKQRDENGRRGKD